MVEDGRKYSRQPGSGDDEGGRKQSRWLLSVSYLGDKRVISIRGPYRLIR